MPSRAATKTVNTLVTWQWHEKLDGCLKIPILPEAYAHFTPPDGRTPYMVWSTESWVTAGVGAANTYEPFELAANELGVQLFKQVFGHDISSDVIKVEPEPQEQE